MAHKCIFSAVVCLVWILSLQTALCQVVRLPITIDMPLLRELIVEQAYRQPGETVSVVDSADGCNRIILAEPLISREGERIRFQTGMHITWGTPLGGQCFAPMTWDGTIVLWQLPRVNQRWQLSFETTDSTLLNMEGRPARAGILWDLVKGHVHKFLGQIIIDLAPPVDDVKSFLLPLFDSAYTDAANRFLDSMRPDQPRFLADVMRIDILAEIDAVQFEEESAPQASPEALAKVMELWQAWDTLLVHVISQLAGQPLSDEERYLLMDTMLTVRHEFEEVLEKRQLTNAFVRGQFIDSWSQLVPIFRKNLIHNPSGNLLGYLTLFTASDALVALDRAGPSLGVEISRDGFHRLAELIGTQPLPQIEATPAVNQLLREVFGLGPPLEVPIEEEELPVEEAPADQVEIEASPPTSWLRLPTRWWSLSFGSGTAWAGEAKVPGLRVIRSWTAEVVPAHVLLPKAESILLKSALSQRKKLQAPADAKGWFDRMMIATAWQESCFRQFRVSKQKITYLLSYNNTSVGIMQVNERIWRGIYDMQQLRWNVQYNAHAGAEILTLYLNRYLSRETPPVDLTDSEGRRFLAGWLYALYNGGPGQRKKFPRRYLDRSLYDSETLFLTKYDQVEGKAWMERVVCLPKS